MRSFVAHDPKRVRPFEKPLINQPPILHFLKRSHQGTFCHPMCGANSLKSLPTHNGRGSESSGTIAATRLFKCRLNLTRSAWVYPKIRRWIQEKRSVPNIAFCHVPYVRLADENWRTALRALEEGIKGRRLSPIEESLEGTVRLRFYIGAAFSALDNHAVTSRRLTVLAQGRATF